MCWKCLELDKVIAHYRDLQLRSGDRLTLRGIGLIIAEAEAEKIALHSSKASAHSDAVFGFGISVPTVFYFRPSTRNHPRSIDEEGKVARTQMPPVAEAAPAPW